MILQASPGDSGVYTCQISAYKPTELNHTLTVRGQYREKLPSVREEICLSPSLNIITTGAILECVSIPIAPSADQTAFKLSSSHLAQSKYSFLIRY